MRCLLLSLLACLLATTAATTAPRIVGGQVTTIGQYPFAASLLMYWNASWRQYCGSFLINNRSLVTAAACVRGFRANEVRARLGSTYAHSGGVVYDISQLTLHPYFNPQTLHADVAVLRLAHNAVFGANVAAASLAGTNYNLPDHAAVTVVGWGTTTYLGLPSEQLRHVQVYSIPQSTCVQLYAPRAISAGMLCAGVLGLGGRDACVGDAGGPLLHNTAVVAVASFTHICGSPNSPFVYARVPYFLDFILRYA